MGYGWLGHQDEVWTMLEGTNMKGSEPHVTAGDGLCWPCWELFDAVCWWTVCVT